MRTLYVSHFYPWPVTSGWSQRLANTVEALVSLGPVDFICLDGSDRPRDPAPRGVRVVNLPEGPRPGVRRWVGRWLRGDLPRQLVSRNFEAAAARIPDETGDDYDLVWVSHIHSWPAIERYLPSPIVMDLDNLEDGALASRRSAGFLREGTGAVAGVGARLRWHAVTVADRIDERRYARLQRAVSERCERLFVCSELDVERSGLPNVTSIPNGHDMGAPSARDVSVADPDAPIFVFVGSYSYGPNVDAVRWFVGDVLGRIRRQIPGARFRIIGQPDAPFDDLRSLDGVEVVGWVDDVAAEVAAADVAVVPLRFGAGTRLKVIEAMANRTPVVSTTLGCEGIEVVDGEHVLMADDAGAFAAASVQLARDEGLRTRLADAAEQRFVDRYQWSTIRERIAEQAREASGVSNDRG